MSQPADKPQRRWHQFSLRALLIATALAAGLTFAWAKCVEPYRLQRKTMAAITKLGGGYETEDAVGSVRYLDKNAQDVVVANVAKCDKPDEYLPYLAGLPRLRTLVVGGRQFGDQHLTALKAVESLRGLVLDSTTVSDKGVKGLKAERPDLVVYASLRRALDAVAEGTIDALDGIYYDEEGNAPPPDWLSGDAGNIYFF